MHASTPAALPSARYSLVCSPSNVAEFCPRMKGRLLTSVDISHAFAPPAADVAAPDKLTLTPLHVSNHMGVVASATA